jgi:Fic family protein
MAHVHDNIVLEGVRGAVGKKVVYKKVNGKTIVSKYPDMSNVTYNKAQKKYQTQFAEAVAYARSVNNDPQQKMVWRKKIAADPELRGTSVYQAVLKERLRERSTKTSPHIAQQLLNKCLQTGEFNERQVKGLQYITTHGQLTNAVYQRINDVSKATATRDLQDLVKKQLIISAGRGGASVYQLLISPDISPGELAQKG